MAAPWLVESLPAAEVNGALDQIMRIERASFANPWTREMYVAELAHTGVAYLSVARDADQGVVGYCSFRVLGDELHLNNLGVAPEHRRAGVGSALLAHALQEGRRLGARRATLEVRRSNGAARRLYERFGFATTGVRRAYYTRPVEDALILWRDSV